jgi:hypothetical protein
LVCSPTGALNAARGCLSCAAVVAVITNALLVSFSSTAMAADLDLFTNIGSRYKQSDLWLTVLVMEHALLVCADLRRASHVCAIRAAQLTCGCHCSCSSFCWPLLCQTSTFPRSYVWMPCVAACHLAGSTPPCAMRLLAAVLADRTSRRSWTFSSRVLITCARNPFPTMVATVSTESAALNTLSAQECGSKRRAVCARAACACLWGGRAGVYACARVWWGWHRVGLCM